MRELAGEYVGEDLGVAVGVRRKSVQGSHAVFVKNTQGAELLEGWVVVLGEGEGVVAVQPAVIGVATVRGTAGDYIGVWEFGHDFCCCLCCYGHGKILGVLTDQAMSAVILAGM